MRELISVQAHSSGGRLPHPNQNASKARLACRARTHDAKKFARPKFEGDALQNRRLAARRRGNDVFYGKKALWTRQAHTFRFNPDRMKQQLHSAKGLPSGE